MKKNKKFGYFDSIHFLMPYIKPHIKHFIRYCVGWFLETILSLTTPILFGIMINAIVYYGDTDTFFEVGVVFIVVSIFSCILFFLIYAQHQYLMGRYMLDIRMRILESMYGATAEYLSSLRAGDVVNLIQRYVEECVHFLTRNIVRVSNNVLMTILYISYVFILSPEMGFFMLVAVPLSVFNSVRFGKKIREYQDILRVKNDDFTSWSFEMFSGIRDLRMLGAQQKINKRFIAENKVIIHTDIKSGISILSSTKVNEFINLIVQLGIFSIAAYMTYEGRMTIGTLLIILTFFKCLVERVTMLATNYMDVQMRIPILETIKNFIESPSESEWKGADDLNIEIGDIEIKDISFQYSGAETLFSGLSFDIKAGERLAIVGKSGCGKSTLAYMLLGFYLPSKGNILIDGKNIEDCSLKSLRRNIGLVAQDVLIFDGTIKENLLMGRCSASDAEIERACCAAGIQEFINNLPDGINTVIGSKGIALSGGQRQRIAISRIYLKEAKILIFDEATSSLDSGMEEKIHNAWEELINGRTSIVIAHRLSSVQMCDRVLMMEDGKIVASGTPKELIESNSKFRELFAIGEEGGKDDE